MNKFDYLLEAFKHRAYARKTFLLSVFSVVHDTPNNKAKLTGVPYALFRDDKAKELYFFRGDERVVVETDNYDQALFNKHDKITTNFTIPGFLDETVETTVGILLVNLVMLYDTIGSAGQYLNKEITDGMIRKLIDTVMVDNPGQGETIPEGKASVDMCLEITKAADYLEGMNSVFVKASSFDAYTVHPEVIALRDKLLKELEEQGKLNDPTAVALMIDEVVALDAKIQYSGPSSDFYINKKFIDNARKKMFIIFDMIPDYNSGKYILLRKSLSEGWDQDQFPQYINTAIAASYDRGNATGEGGAEVKVAILLTNRMLAIDTDCGSKRTEEVKLTRYNANGWIGSNYMVDGKVEQVTAETIKTGLGKVFQMRVAQFCQQPDDNLCRVCCGEKLGSIPERLSSEVVFIFTQFMLSRMKGMHVSQLITVKMELEDILR